MKKLIQLTYVAGIIICAAVLNSCNKNPFEPSIEGTWVEIDNTTTQTPLGCELIIDKSSGDVTLCGIKFVHPYNVVTLTTKKRATLVVKDGQMYYKQKKADILWIAPIAKELIYFLDYDLDGQFLWIIGDDTSSKVTAKNVGRVFKKK